MAGAHRLFEEPHYPKFDFLFIAIMFILGFIIAVGVWAMIFSG